MASNFWMHGYLILDISVGQVRVWRSRDLSQDHSSNNRLKDWKTILSIIVVLFRATVDLTKNSDDRRENGDTTAHVWRLFCKLSRVFFILDFILFVFISLCEGRTVWTSPVLWYQTYRAWRERTWSFGGPALPKHRRNSTLASCLYNLHLCDITPLTMLW